MTAALTAAVADPLGAAMVDHAAGRLAPLWLRYVSGRRLAHELADYFAPVVAEERACSTWPRAPSSTSAAGRPGMPGCCRPAA